MKIPRILTLSLRQLFTITLACILLINFFISIGTGGIIILILAPFMKEFSIFGIYLLYHILIATALYILWFVGIYKKYMFCACLLALLMSYIHIQYIEFFDIFILGAD